MQLKNRSKSDHLAKDTTSLMPGSSVVNLRLVQAKVDMSCTRTAVLLIALLIFILCSWVWIAVLLYMTIDGSSSSLYSPMYNWLCFLYCLLISLYALAHLRRLANCGPTKLCRISVVMLGVLFIEYLISTNVLFSIKKVSFPEYRLQILSTIALSLVRLFCALATYLLARFTLSGTAWDVGDPVQ